MEWEGREESKNVEDRRQMGKRVAVVGGGAGILIVLAAMFLGVDPQKLAGLFGGAGGDAPPGQEAPAEKQFSPEEQRMARFTKVILRDTEVVWDKLFRQMDKRYVNPKLVLFSGSVDSACGTADSAVGPFYCPGDSMVYIDLSFYTDMEKKLNAGGEFARAYVIAHEVGHHVQRLLGYSARVDEARGRVSKVEENHLSVRLELQADFLAGVWAHHTKEDLKLNEADIESALNAAFEIGDDRLQKKARGRVVPDSFTHGSSEQRQSWFMYGYKTGDVRRARLLFDLEYRPLLPPRD
jgi:predicted metalloprotease